MEKEFVPYEQALALKKLGFDEPCFNKFYTKPNSKMFGIDDKGRHYPMKNTAKKLYTIGEHFVLKDDNVILAPLYQQAFRWLYQKLDIEKGVMPLDIESQQLLLKELIDKVSSKHLLV
jgi:hypothetical protein